MTLRAQKLTIGEPVVVSVRASSDVFSLLLEAVGGDDHGNTPASATALLSGLPVLPTLQGPSGSPVAVDAQGNFTAPQSGAYFLSVANDMRSGNAWVGGYSVQVH